MSRYTRGHPDAVSPHVLPARLRRFGQGRSDDRQSCPQRQQNHTVEDATGRRYNFPHYAPLALSVDPVRISTWTYEGWQGQVYTRQYAMSTFARECLGEHCPYEYQGEPLCGTEGNATFYRPPTTNQLRRYLNQISEDFQMCFKVWEEITIPSYVLSDEGWGQAV